MVEERVLMVLEENFKEDDRLLKGREVVENFAELEKAAGRIK